MVLLGVKGLNLFIAEGLWRVKTNPILMHHSHSVLLVTFHRRKAKEFLKCIVFLVLVVLFLRVSGII